jgi:hypothetical protein
MLVAAFPERFEVPADHVGDSLGEVTAIGGGDGYLGLERDPRGDLRQRVKRGACVKPCGVLSVSFYPLDGRYLCPLNFGEVRPNASPDSESGDFFHAKAIADPRCRCAMAVFGSGRGYGEGRD